MMKQRWIRFGLVLATAGISLSAQAAKNKDMTPPSGEVMQKIDAAIPDQAPAQPKSPRKVLVFYRTEGYFHPSIPTGNAALVRLGEKTGAYTADVSEDMSVFDDGGLDAYDAIIFNNTTRLDFSNETRLANLMAFARSGKGIIGIHAASDNFYCCEEAAAMMGGQFSGHPWTAGGTWAVKLDEPDHPLNRSFEGHGFQIKDEIYQIMGPFSRASQRVLLSLDMDAEQNWKVDQKKIKRTDKDFPITWLKREGEGRVFYCSLGHNHAIYWHPAVLRHYLAGIQYALGDLAVDDAPVSPPAPVWGTESLPAFMGDWSGAFVNPSEKAGFPHKDPELVARVTGMGGDRFKIQLVEEFERRAPLYLELDVPLTDGVLRFEQGGWKGEISNDSFSGSFRRQDVVTPFALKKVERLSDTLGKPAPPGAEILFDGSTLDRWRHDNGSAITWKSVGGVLECVPRNKNNPNGGTISTRDLFADFELHLEFRLPYEPDHRGQKRANSGLMIQGGAYEIQILDSYGLGGMWDECGALYRVAPPKVNRCRPPGQWQTYDVDFQAARYDEAGKLVSHPVVTVRHNGELIHNQQELLTHCNFGQTKRRTLQHPKEPGRIALQDHGHPIQFRNIWILER